MFQAINDGFTREEEIDYGTIKDIPFLLEKSLTRNTTKFTKVQPWQEFVIKDGRVITGQNPSSASAVGKALIEQLFASLKVLSSKYCVQNKGGRFHTSRLFIETLFLLTLR